MKMTIDASEPTFALCACGDQLHTLADFLSFSGEDFQLSDRARAGMASTLLAVAETLDRVEDMIRTKTKPNLKVV